MKPRFLLWPLNNRNSSTPSMSSRGRVLTLDPLEHRSRCVNARRLSLEPLEARHMLSLSLVVDSLPDIHDSDFSVGNLSLREAIEQANDSPGADEIALDPALFAGGPASILLDGGELSIRDDLTLSGPGQDLLTLDANNGSRVFEVSSDDAISVTISGLTIANGFAERGAGLLNTEQLHLSDVTITAGVTADGADGELGESGGDAGVGGGIYNSGTMTMTDCTVSDNQTGSGGDGSGSIFGEYYAWW